MINNRSKSIFFLLGAEGGFVYFSIRTNTKYMDKRSHLKKWRSQKRQGSYFLKSLLRTGRYQFQTFRDILRIINIVTNILFLWHSEKPKKYCFRKTFGLVLIFNKISKVKNSCALLLISYYTSKLKQKWCKNS